MSTATTARYLRRFLGSLLALGFGATWWSFIPVAAAVSSIAIAPELEPIAGGHTSAIARVEPPPQTPIEFEAAWILRPPTPLVDIVTLNAPTDVPTPHVPVDEPTLVDYPPIRTRSS